MTQRVICDCDNTLGVPGRPIDDGQAMLYLFGRPDIELIGVTTTFGNGPIEDVHPATVQFMLDAGHGDIPVVEGEGERGQPPTAAAHYLAETVAAAPGEITLLAIGPLGNLRAAAEVDPDFFRNLKQIAIMGGYLEALPIPGWEQVQEVNLAGDPEAAYVTLNGGCPITLMNAQVCLMAPYGLDHLDSIKHWEGSSIHHSIRDWLVQCEIRHNGATEFLWDMLPAVYISFPDLFDSNPVHLVSSVEDLETGTLVLGGEGEGSIINMPSRILDVERFYEIVYEGWKRVALDR
jgi:purine nucleosidase